MSIKKFIGGAMLAVLFIALFGVMPVTVLGSRVWIFYVVTIGGAAFIVTAAFLVSSDD